MKLPYFGSKCEDNSYLKLAFATPSDSSNYFSFKEKINEVESNPFKCKECSGDYICETERILAYRIT